MTMKNNFHIISNKELINTVGGRKYANAYIAGQGFGNMAKWLVEASQLFL